MTSLTANEAAPASIPDEFEAAHSIAWFADLRRDDVAVAGGKGANLGEVTAAGFPVPPGFVVTAGAYLAAMEAGGVRAALASEGAAPGSASALTSLSDRLRALVRGAGLPDELRHAIGSAYAELGRRVGDEHPVVAVRSSATAEDAADTSFAGMNRTFTNVRGARRAGHGRGRRVGVAVRRTRPGVPDAPTPPPRSRPSPSWCKPWCRTSRRPAWPSPPTP